MCEAQRLIYLVTEEKKADRYFILEDNDHQYGNNHDNCLSIFEDLIKYSDSQLTFQVFDFDEVGAKIKDQLESFTQLKLFLAERMLGLI